MKFIHVGVGGFGGVWVNLLKATRAAKVVAMVDVNDDALDRACETGGYSPDICFKSIEDALANVEADAAVVVTPPASHRQPVVAAMKAGLDVISEKPMAESLADCKAMLRAAAATGRTYVVSQNYRYTDPMWTLSKLVRGGKLGAVGQVKADFYMGVDFGGGFRHDMAYPLIIDMSIHHFDLIRFITGLDAVNVTGSAWNPTWSTYKGDCSNVALFEMNSGARVVYNASWCAKGTFCDWNANWQIECEKGTVVYSNGEITVYDVPKLYNAKKVTTAKLSKPPRSSQAFVLHDFIRAVSGGPKAQTDAFDNIRSVAMIFATVKAMQTGRTVPILDKATKDLIR